MEIGNITEHSTFIIGLSGTIILGLLAILWFYIKRDLGRIDKQQQDMLDLVTKLDTKLDDVIKDVIKVKTEHELYHKNGGISHG